MYNINQFCHCEDSEGICGNLSILQQLFKIGKITTSGDTVTLSTIFFNIQGSLMICLWHRGNLNVLIPETVVGWVKLV